MKDISKYIPQDTFLAELLNNYNTKPTSQLADFWVGVFNIIGLIQNKDLIYNKELHTLSMHTCFISNNPNDYECLFSNCFDFILKQQALCKNTPQIVTEIPRKNGYFRNNVLCIFPNLADLDDKDRIAIRNNLIFTTTERKIHDNYYFMSGIYGTNIDDYVTILGTRSEKASGLLANSIPVYSGQTKRRTESSTNETNTLQCFRKFVQFTETEPKFVISDDGFRHYCTWCSHRIPLRGYYGQILERIKDKYCLKLATSLACNKLKQDITIDDVDNALKIMDITCKEALKMFEEEMNLDNSSKFITVLEKIKKFLMFAGSNGLQHRSLYMKVHHDIDNETFRYLMTLLHEFNLIEKLQVSHNSIIYRACDTLVNLDVNEFIKNIKDIS